VWARVAAASGLALAVTASVLVVPAAPSHASMQGTIDVLGDVDTISDDVLAHLESCTTGSVQRIVGEDRYATAAAISRERFETAEVAFVATGEEYAHAASIGSSAAREAAPILLVEPDGIPGSTADELDRLDPSTLYLLGGGSSVSPTVESQLTDYASVVRLPGTNRYEVAASVSRSGYASGAMARFVSAVLDRLGPAAVTPLGGTDVVYVAGGKSYLDAIAGSVAAGRESSPILLVGQDRIPTATKGELERLRPTEIVVLGGTGVVSSLLEFKLGAYAPRVTRLAGSTRYTTAATISQRAFPDGAAAIFIATADDLPDALVSGAAGAHVGGPVLLVTEEEVPAATAAEISRLTGVPCEPFPIGGPCPSGLIALTFDDGPLPQRTNAILTALDRADIRATFFTVGYLVEDYPEVVQKAAEAGHAIASHTYLHEILPSMSDAEITQTLRKADSAIRAAGVTPVPLVRPPGGMTDARVQAAIENAGFRQLMWTWGPQDYDDWGGWGIAKGVIAHAEDQAVIVLHDNSKNYQNTVAATEAIVEVLSDRGYCFGVLDRNGRVVR